MRKLTVNTFLTLDGVMQAPGGPEEDPSDGFRFGGWSAPLWDQGMDEVMGGVMGEPFDLLLGRRTYEIFAAHWPNADERATRGGDESGVDDEAAAALNSARKYVASRTLDRVDWNNSVLLEGDVVEAVAELKRQPGPEIQVHGSADLLQTLLRSDLVDELSLFTFPVVVGHGKRLFTDGAAADGDEGRRREGVRHRRRVGALRARGRRRHRVVRVRGPDPGGGRAAGEARRRVTRRGDR